ncbi:MAG: leucine-rich repeat domain-containing protein [Candidatus Limisoma sp.]|nr:leucine-rich repeat domain-containing protein [Candidatus Limisoma sp.]
MRSLILTFIYIIVFTAVAEAESAYYYYGQYFRITSSNTVELIKPIKGENMTLKQEYSGDFVIYNFIPINGNAYFVTKIADSAFEGSTITTLTLGKYIDSIGESACANCKTINEFYSNEKLAYIGNNAFNGCSNLSKVLFSDSLTYIGNGAFDGCSNLSEVLLPENLTYIGDRAFKSCKLQEELSIPSSVVSIGKAAFMGTKISTLNLRPKELKIGEYAFALIPNFEIINISSLTDWCNYVFDSVYSNPLYYAKTLKLNNETIVDLDLNNEQITSIPIDAFIKQNTIKTVKLGPNLETISNKAFYTSSIDSVFIASKTPPTINEDSFTLATYIKSVLTVPFGCSEIYRETPYWSSFKTIIEENESSGIDNFTIKKGVIRINGRNISISKPIQLVIYSIDGKCLFNGISNSYSFTSPGVYIVNGVKYSIK